MVSEGLTKNPARLAPNGDSSRGNGASTQRGPDGECGVQVDAPLAWRGEELPRGCARVSQPETWCLNSGAPSRVRPRWGAATHPARPLFSALHGRELGIA